MFVKAEKTDSESLHRLVKALVDSGEAPSIEKAFSTFSAYGVRIRLGANLTASAQIIALTMINVAARSFLGNVVIEGAMPAGLTVRGVGGSSLKETLIWVGGGNGPFPLADTWPVISVGTARPAVAGEIRVWADGWVFGLGGGGECTDHVYPPACVAAAGLAVNEAFSLLRKDNPYAGRRDSSWSLWNFSDHTDKGPRAEILVPGLWEIGLGHLGQAYSWTLGFMRQAPNSKVFLQDVDAISGSTLSTSLLSGQADVGKSKARVAAKWLEDRGFQTAIVERRFDENQRVSAAEPRLALLGVDNPAARRAIEGAGFEMIVDAGLGSGYKNFRALRVHTFPGPSQASAIWASDVMTFSSDAPAYKAMLADGEDPCGVTTLATRAVGAPFVGCVAAGYALSEVFRRQLAGDRHSFIDCNLRDINKTEFEVI